LDKRIKEILHLLAGEYPHIGPALNHKNPFQLLVAVILSAQTTDQQVNKVTEKLFTRIKGPADILEMGSSWLEKQIRTLGLFRRKSQHIYETSLQLMEKHGGCVPHTRGELQNLPGIGRKSAGVILSTVFGVPALAVDTHVARVSRRLGLTDGSNPYVVEEDLCRLLPPDLWTMIHRRFIAHGRKICRARKPLCDECFLLPHCPQNFFGSGK